MTSTKPQHRMEARRFVKFSIVGGIGFVVDFAAFNLFHGLLNIDSVASSVLSFSTAVLSNFIWNRFWTYPDSRSKSIHVQASQFLTVNLVGLLIRTPVFALIEGPLTRVAESLIRQSTELSRWVSSVAIEPALLGSNLALAAAVIVVLFWNFGANRLWTYSDID